MGRVFWKIGFSDGIDPCAPPTRVRDYLQDPKERQQGVRRVAMRNVRAVAVRVFPLPISSACRLVGRNSHGFSHSVVRAFLIEEAKIVKRVIKQQTSSRK